MAGVHAEDVRMLSEVRQHSRASFGCGLTWTHGDILIFGATITTESRLEKVWKGEISRDFCDASAYVKFHISDIGP